EEAAESRDHISTALPMILRSEIAGDIRPLSQSAPISSPYGTARTTPCHRAAILPESVGLVKQRRRARAPGTLMRHEHENAVDGPRRVLSSMRSLDSLPLLRPLELPRAA